MSLVLPTFDLNDAERWGWGILGRAGKFTDVNQFTITDIIESDTNFTISA